MNYLSSILTPQGFAATFAAAASSILIVRKWAAGGTVPSAWYKQNLSGKVAIVTGGNGGIGFETAKQLAAQGVHVIIATRNEDRAREAVKAIKDACKNATVDYLLLDTSDLDSVRAFVKEFENKKLPLHFLINNAGGFLSNHGLSKQGVELNFAQNYLGHFLLTNLLLENVKKNNGRIINVSSRAHQRGLSKIFFDELKTDCSKYSKWQLYSHSKLAQIMFTYELERKLRADPTTTASVHALHPGVVRTSIWKGIDAFVAPLTWLFWKSTFEGAQTTLYLALSPETPKGGQYWSDCAPRKSIPESFNEDDQAKLWKISAELCGLSQ